ncbi:MAG: hypothetical protein Q9170_004153, partial [Blastenia crenularia]
MPYDFADSLTRMSLWPATDLWFAERILRGAQTAAPPSFPNAYAFPDAEICTLFATHGCYSEILNHYKPRVTAESYPWNDHNDCPRRDSLVITLWAAVNRNPGLLDRTMYFSAWSPRDRAVDVDLSVPANPAPLSETHKALARFARCAVRWIRGMDAAESLERRIPLSQRSLPWSGFAPYGLDIPGGDNDGAVGGQAAVTSMARASGPEGMTRDITSTRPGVGRRNTVLAPPPPSLVPVRDCYSRCTWMGKSKDEVKAAVNRYADEANASKERGMQREEREARAMATMLQGLLEEKIQQDRDRGVSPPKRGKWR